MKVFRSNRNKNSIYKGIKESLAKKIADLRKKGRNIDPSDEEEIDFSSDEEKLRKIVEDLIKQKGYDQFVNTLKYLLESNEAELAKAEEGLAAAESEEDKNKYEDLIAEYSAKINDLKDQIDSMDAMYQLIIDEEAKKHLESLAVEIENYVLETESYKKEIDEALAAITELLSDPVANITKLTDNVNKMKMALVNHTQTVTDFVAAQLKYQKLCGSTYDAEYVSINMSTEDVKDIYRMLAAKINELNKTITATTDANKKDSLQAAVKTIEEAVGSLYLLLENPDDFKKIKAEVDSEFQNAYNANDVKKFKDEVKAAIVAERSNLINKLTKLDVTVKDDYEKLLASFKDIALNYTTLTHNEINVAVSEALKEEPVFGNTNPKVVDYLVGNNFSYFDSKMIKRLNEILKGSTQEVYGTSAFEYAYAKARAFIKELQSDSKDTSLGMQVSFNERSQNLKIQFNDPKIHFEQRIVSLKTLEMMREPKVDKEALLAEYKTKARAILDKFIASYLKKLSRLEKVDYEKTTQELLALASSYSKLSDTEITKAYEEVKKQAYGVYTKEEIEKFKFIEEKLTPLYNSDKVTRLRSMYTDNPEFNDTYEAVKNNIQELVAFLSTEENQKMGIKVEYKEEEGSLYVSYGSKHLQDFCVQVVNNKALEALKKKAEEPKKDEENPEPNPQGGSTGEDKPAPAPTEEPAKEEPPKAEPQTDEMDAAQKEYLERLRILNDTIQLLNNINLQLEAAAAQTTFMYPSNRMFVTNTIALEQKARELENNISKQRLELSNLRLAYTDKFQKFIYSVPEIKDFQLEEEKFSSKTQEFIALCDRLIVEAENSILEIVDKKKNDPTNASMYDEQINELLQFIEAQNSAVGRALVVEARKNNINIVEVLNERRKNKRDLREAIRQAQEKGNKGPEPEPSKPLKTAEQILTEASETFTKFVRGLTDEQLLADNLSEIIATEIARICANEKIGKLSIQYNINQNMADFRYQDETSTQSMGINIFTKEQIEKMNAKKDIPLTPQLLENVGKSIYRASSETAEQDKQKTVRDVLVSMGITSETTITTILNLFVAKGVIKSATSLVSEITMTQEEFTELVVNNKPKKEEPAKEQPAKEQPEQPEQTEPSQIVVNNKKLNLNPKSVPKINRRTDLVFDQADKLTVSLIKNGIKIKYSQSLAKKLHDIKARIALVNKDNYRQRKTTRPYVTIDENGNTIPVEGNEIAFKTKESINPEDYKVEIRVPEGVLYEYDLSDAKEEENPGMKL